MKKVLLIIAAGLLLVACNERLGHMERMAQNFSRETITVPSGLVQVFDGQSGAADLRENMPKMIYWFDSTQCSMCNAKRLAYLDPLYRLAETESPFDVLLVFSPEAKDAKKTVETMELFDLAHPVLIDMNQSFYKANPAMEDYPFFHRFYMDAKGHPKFVGDPISSEELWTVFEDVVRKK